MEELLGEKQQSKLQAFFSGSMSTLAWRHRSELEGHWVLVLLMSLTHWYEFGQWIQVNSGVNPTFAIS